MDSTGNIYVADTYNARVRKITRDGIIRTIAGGGANEKDGIAATSASLSMPHDVTVSRRGEVFIADSGHHRIRRVDRTGIITTIAGTGARGSSGNGGRATRAQLKNPKSVALHGGALYTSGLDNEVRRINLRTGIIHAVAGTGTPGYSGDGGPAARARLDQPRGLTVTPHGALLIAEPGNSVIRKVAG